MNKQNQIVKESITESLLKLLKKKKFNEINIKEITTKAGVGRVSFYRNYNSKEDILIEYLDKITNDFLEESKINFQKDNLHDFITVLFSHLEKHKNLAFNLYKSNLLYLIKDEFTKIFDTRNKNYDKYKSSFYSGGIFEVYSYWLINGAKEKPKELADKLVDLLEK